MYPFNINSRGEMIELTDKESSLETHNDEDAIIIYDEQDQEEDMDSLKLGEGAHKHSNLFNSSFFSDLSSVHQPKCKNEAQLQGEKNLTNFNKIEGREDNKVALIEENEIFSHHNSFLDQDLNIESIPFEADVNEIVDYPISSIHNEEQDQNKHNLEDVLGLFNDETGRFNYEDEKSLGKDINFEPKKAKKPQETKINNLIEKNSSDKTDNFNKLVSNNKIYGINKASRDQNYNNLKANENKAKSVPADE